MGLNVIARSEEDSFAPAGLAMISEGISFVPYNDNGNWKCTLLYPITLGQCKKIT